MSYIRAGHGMKFVKGKGKDYIFLAEDVSGEPYIEDYGGITNEGLVECIARIIYSTNQVNLWKDYLIKHLADRLNVELKEENYGVWD